MARADRRSVRSSRANAAARSSKRDSDLVAIEDTMFFTRLRRHAKWMFVFLALVFGVGFVVFGIGAEPERQHRRPPPRRRRRRERRRLRLGGARAGGEEPEERRGAAHPRDRAPGGRPDRRGDRRPEPLPRARAEGQGGAAGARRAPPRPGDRARARRAGRSGARELSSRSARPSAPPLDLGKGATIGPDPIDEAISTQANQAVNEAYTAAQASFQKAEETYDRLAAVAPSDPNVQLELAQAAQQSGDIAKAIAAYERFLELAPDDPTAPIVKQQIEQLKAAQAPAPDRSG